MPRAQSQVPGGCRGSWAHTLSLLSEHPRRPLKCPLERVQDFTLVTKATNKIQEAKKMPSHVMSQLKT